MSSAEWYVSCYCKNSLNMWKNAYFAPYRKYHNYQHINEVVRHVHYLASKEYPVALNEIMVAALFHDFVYTPGYESNDVLQSAEIASFVAESNGFHGEACNRIFDLVMKTGDHGSAVIIDQKIICDADLAVLGSKSRYLDYKNQIRQEYCLIPDNIFYPKRKEILQNLLDGPLYHTDTAKKEWEDAARQNISKEIEDIERKLQ